MRGRFLPAAGFVLVLLASFPGCLFFSKKEAGVGNYFLAGDFSSNGIRRVGCLPLQKETYCYDDLQTLQSIFLQELQRKGVFEVILLDPEEGAALSRLSRPKNAYPSEWVLAVKKRYRLDGILVARVTHYNPYEPKILGVRGELINSRTGDMSWSVDVLFDSSERETLEDMKRFFALKESSFGWKLPLFSHKHFLRYACSRIFETFTPEVRRRGSPWSPFRGPVIRAGSPQLP